MKKLRILQLVDRDLVPPEHYEGDDYTGEPWKAEYDVLLTLREQGHEVRTLGVVRNVDLIERTVREWRPHISFNMLEDVYGVIPYDQNMVSYLELLGLAYTGCNPLGLQLSRDKSLTKKLVAYHNIRTPKFIVCRPGRKVRRPTRLGFPLIVKVLVQDASAGISQQSIVENDDALRERVAFIHEQFDSEAIVEEFVRGREFYVGVFGNTRLDVLPPWELIVENKREDAPLIATHKMKWDANYQKKLGVVTRRAENLPNGLEARIVRMSRRIYRILRLSGYARLDFRLSEDGHPYLIEANPNPQLAFGEDFAESAEHAGLPYGKLLQRILSLGLRWKQAHELM